MVNIQNEVLKVLRAAKSKLSKSTNSSSKKTSTTRVNGSVSSLAAYTSSNNPSNATTEEEVDDAPDIPMAQQKVATTYYTLGNEAGSYQAYTPELTEKSENIDEEDQWGLPFEIMFSKFTITETDMRVKTATFSSNHNVDLTMGRTCVWIQRRYGENFGGVILSCELNQDTGLYDYTCQDWNRLLTSKVDIVLAGDTTSYDAIRETLIKCYLSTDGLLPIEEYDGIIDLVPQDDDPNESLERSSTSEGGTINVNSTINTDYVDDDVAQQEAALAKRNPFRQKKEGFYDRISHRDFIMALAMQEGANIDVHMDENGVLQFEKYVKDDWRKERWYFVDNDVYDVHLKFDITDIITQVAVKHTDPLQGEATMYSSENLIGVNLASFFGVMGTVIDNPVKSSGGGTGVVGANGDTITVKGYPTSICCSKAYNGVRPPYKVVTRSYRNYCTQCGKSSTLRWEWPQSIKGVTDGEITCGNTGPAVKSQWKGDLAGCDGDFCCCCGYEKMYDCETRLIPVGATGTASSTTSSNTTSTTPSSSGTAVSSSTTSTDTTSNESTSTDVATTDIGSNQQAVENYTKNKMAARIAMSESIRKWYTFTFKLAGEYDKLHTNSFCMLMMSKHFASENIPTIGKQLEGKFTRYVGYEKNRFYIEGVTVTYDEASGLYTELKLNPFASDFSTFAKTQLRAEEALASALGGNGSTGNANGTDCTDDGGRTNKISIGYGGSATAQTPTQEALKVIGNSSANYAEIAAQAQGNPATALKLMYQRWTYEGYSDNAHGAERCPQKMYAMPIARGNCADSSWLMKCIFDCMGLQNYILHGSPQGEGHYWNCVQWNGVWFMGDLCYWKKSHNQLSKM